MLFEFIKLKNYRQYQDSRIDFFPFDSDKNFVIIVGGTGCGKTNIMNAVTWCLYAMEFNIRDKDRGLPLINLVTFDEMKEGESREVSVEIQAQSLQGDRIIFNRVLNFAKRQGKPHPVRDHSSRSQDGSTFTLFRQIDRDIISVSDPEFILNRLIPQSIEEYFFFDGERLDDYFKQTSKARIKDAVLKISQIGLLENLLKHLQDRKNNFTRESRSMSSNAKKISEALETWRRSKEREEEELGRIKSDRNESRNRFDEISSKLQSSSNLDVKSLEEERRVLEAEVTELGSRLTKLEQEKLKFLVENTSSLLTNQTLMKLSELIKTREESGKIPPEFRKSFLERLLRDGKCICGADLVQDEARRKPIEVLLKEHDELGELSNLLIRVQGTINSLHDRARGFDVNRMKINKEITNLEVRRVKSSKRIEQISETIGSINVGEILRLEAERQEWLRKLEQLNLEAGKKEHQIEEYEKRINNLDRSLKIELRKDERSQELANVCDFCDDAFTIGQTIRTEIMSEIKDEIEKKTERQFLSFIWKATDYKKVSIDMEYNVSVTHQSGLEGIGTLSAGEGIVLAMSFMAAINSVSGFDVPIIIDTPLGRIAGAPREQIARNLPEYLPGKQVIMLVTDTEYTEAVRSLLARRVVKTFRIDFTEMGMGGVAKVIHIE